MNNLCVNFTVYGEVFESLNVITCFLSNARRLYFTTFSFSLLGDSLEAFQVLFFNCLKAFNELKLQLKFVWAKKMSCYNLLFLFFMKFQKNNKYSGAKISKPPFYEKEKKYYYKIISPI